MRMNREVIAKFPEKGEQRPERAKRRSRRGGGLLSGGGADCGKRRRGWQGGGEGEGLYFFAFLRTFA